MKASIHLHSHNIHARERLPQRKQAPFKEKTISPPQQIPANLPGPGRQERRREERREWWTPARLAVKRVSVCICKCVWVPVLLHAEKVASDSIRHSFDTSLMHPVLEFHSSDFQHLLPPNTRLSHLALKYLRVRYKCFFLLLFSYYIYVFFFLLCVVLKIDPKDYFRPIFINHNISSPCAWFVFVWQFNTRCNMSQSIIWLSMFIFLPY